MTVFNPVYVTIHGKVYVSTDVSTFIEILPMWKPGIQADAHEVLIGILNSAPVTSNINDLLQFETVTTGN